MEKEYTEDAKIFKALCDEKRLKIISLLRSGEKCACVLIDDMGIGQSALSYHMKILCESGIVDSRQEGKWTHYRLSASGRDRALKRLAKLTTPDLNREQFCYLYRIRFLAWNGWGK